MSVVETMLGSIVATVVGALIVEWIREAREKGNQPLEQVFHFCVDTARTIFNFVKEHLK